MDGNSVEVARATNWIESHEAAIATLAGAVGVVIADAGVLGGLDTAPVLAVFGAVAAAAHLVQKVAQALSVR